MKYIYLSLDTQHAKSVLNSICKIFSGVLPKQLMEIDKTFLCQKLEGWGNNQNKIVTDQVHP